MDEEKKYSESELQTILAEQKRRFTTVHKVIQLYGNNMQIGLRIRRIDVTEKGLVVYVG